MNQQRAPYPDALKALTERLVYRPGWSVELLDLVRDEGAEGLTLIITTCGYDSEAPERGQNYRVNHLFPVPPATYNERNWRRWLFDRYLDVERHEAAEFFCIDGERPFQPWHREGNDPYTIHELTTLEDLEQRHR